MNIHKIKKELTAPIFNHINTLNKEQLLNQKKQLEIDIKLIETDIYFKGNKHDLYRIRTIELSYLNYLLS